MRQRHGSLCTKIFHSGLGYVLGFEALHTWFGGKDIQLFSFGLFRVRHGHQKGGLKESNVEEHGFLIDGCFQALVHEQDVLLGLLSLVPLVSWQLQDFVPKYVTSDRLVPDL